MDKFAEYRYFADSTNGLSGQRQAATQVYLAVNSAVFTVLAFLLKDAAGLDKADLFLISVPLFAVGSLTCVLWSSSITRYRQLIGWRYKQLMELEKAIPECYGMYQKEWESFFGEEHERAGFSRLEKWLPRLFMVLYVAYAVGSALFAILAG